VRKYEAKPVALTYCTYSSLRARRISARHSLSTGICSLRYYLGSSGPDALREGSERDLSSKHLISTLFCTRPDHVCGFHPIFALAISVAGPLSYLSWARGSGRPNSGRSNTTVTFLHSGRWSDSKTGNHVGIA